MAKNRWAAIAAMTLLTITLTAAVELELEEYCRLESGAAVRGNPPPDGLQYAPNRLVDILNVTIDVTPDFDQRTVAGTTTIRFKPIANPIKELRLDAIRLTIGSVESSVPLAGYHANDKEVIISFAEPIEPGREVDVTIEHEAEPRQGLYFRTPEMGYKPGDMHLFTQGESHEASHWFPVYDYPNEKFTSDMICRVPEGMIALSNGTKISEVKDAATGLTAFHWRQDKPHVSYLIALCAGYFEKIEERYGDLEMAFYTPPSYIAQAANSFQSTARAMAFFEEEIGVPYPWDRYDQVVVDDFVAGGMENTSMTILTTRTLFTEETGNLRSSDGLVAHELAHQWFGDLLTCKDWSHIWLNEGFATYYDLLFSGHDRGRDFMLHRLWGNSNRITGNTSGPFPIVNRKWDESSFMFGFRSYAKGGWVLHMLRSELGEDLYRQCIQTYTERHLFGSVVTEDLNQVIEELSGRSFDRFFDQWIYHGRFPALKITYNWQPAEKLAKISVRQTQEVNDKVRLFSFPAKFRFKSGDESVDRDVLVNDKEQDFYFRLDRAPETVRFDPEFTLLATVDFNKPNAMLIAQLADESDVIGRLRAVKALGEKGGKKNLATLKATLQNDPFFGVRVEASKAIRALHTKEAFEALAESADQDDARVRRQVVQDMGGFYREESRDALLATLKNEKNTEIAAATLRGLARYPQDEQVKELILENLKASSYKDVLFGGAVAAIRSLDDADYIDPLRDALEDREKTLTSRALGQGLSALAWLARDEDDKSEVAQYLLRHVNDPRARVQRGSISALGTLGEKTTLGAVEAFTTADADPALKRAAERAAESIREGKPSSGSIGDLRTEVLDLKKKNEKIEKELEDLNKKIDAKGERGDGGARKKKLFGIF